MEILGQISTEIDNTVQKSLSKLFGEWRKKAKDGPLLVFWDEADSIGRRGASEKSDYWFGPTINAWLAFLDGAVDRTNIIVVAATNFPDRIADALKRVGRLEKVVEIPRPGIESLAGIISHHVPAPVEDLGEAAVACRGRTPASIAGLCREARRIARQAKRIVTAGDVIAAAAASRPARAADVDWAYCWHEAAHAVVSLAVGLTVQAVDADAGICVVPVDPLMNLARAKAHLTAFLAARRADALLGGGVRAGAQGDLEMATALAREAVARLGLTGQVYHCAPGEAERVHEVRREVKELLDACDLRAAKLVDARRDDSVRFAEALRERRYLDGAEVVEAAHARSA